MRAKQSSTALETYSNSEPFKPSVSMQAAGIPVGVTVCGPLPVPRSFLAHPSRRRPVSCPAAPQGEGLLHDARNLVGALGLYCDLLSMPGVLKPEHRHYAEEVRLLGSRSAAMIQKMMEHCVGFKSTQDESAGTCLSMPASFAATDAGPGRQPGSMASSVSLRGVVERCSGLLSRVAAGKAIEIRYGAAAAAPVAVSEDAIERILVNLVRNAAAALTRLEPASTLEKGARGGDEATRFGGPRPAADPPGCMRETCADPADDETPGAIRIGVGLLANRVGEPKPWPFRRVRLTVEDSGCGMTQEQLEWLLCATRAPSRGSHGIGFRVVRELAAASGGELRVMSAPGVGTRVQIEWPLAAYAATENLDREEGRGAAAERRLSC